MAKRKADSEDVAWERYIGDWTEYALGIPADPDIVQEFPGETAQSLVDTGLFEFVGPAPVIAAGRVRRKHRVSAPVQAGREATHGTVAGTTSAAPVNFSNKMVRSNTQGRVEVGPAGVQVPCVDDHQSGPNRVGDGVVGG